MTKTLQQIKDEVACEDNFHNWDHLLESCAMYDYGRLEKAIEEVAIRYSQEQNKELVEMLNKSRLMIGKLKRSMLVHPDCELGSEFCDYTTDAQNLEDEIEELIKSATEI